MFEKQQLSVEEQDAGKSDPNAQVYEGRALDPHCSNHPARDVSPLPQQLLLQTVNT